MAYLSQAQHVPLIVITGDFNVAHENIDIARPKGNERNAGFTIEERQWHQGCGQKWNYKYSRK